MLSLGYPLRKSCSGPVGGHGLAVKVGPAFRNRKGQGKCAARKCTPGYLPPKQPCDEEAELEPAASERRPPQPSEQRPEWMLATRLLAKAPDRDVPPSPGPGIPRIPQSRSEAALPRQSAALDAALAKLEDEQHLLQRESQRRQRGGLRTSRNLSSAGSLLSRRSSCASSSCPSQAVRSTVLDLELQLERERRAEVEAELSNLRARLAAQGGSR
mmetsp:Transcript_113589/g.331895  ORF Transcript_113589/g.331895 Transcript_113589/m.331895 type:complete len:214 (-) Transcript_113589:77-718(-)